MPDGERRVFAARLAALPATAAFVDAFCARNELASADALRLTLVVEELFTNTVVHGYRGESDAPIEVTLAAAAGTIEVTLAAAAGTIEVLYEDAAPRYDPLAQLAAAPDHLHGTVESRPAGGLGIHLIGELVTGACYAHEDGRNRIGFRMICRG